MERTLSGHGSSEPRWMCVIPSAASHSTFVAIRCYDALTWTRLRRALEESAEPLPRRPDEEADSRARRTSTHKARKRPRNPSLDEDLDLHLDPCQETLHSYGDATSTASSSNSNSSRATCATDVLDVSVLQLVSAQGEGERPSNTAAAPEGGSRDGTQVGVWRSSSDGLRVDTLVPRGMTSVTYCALLDECVRRQDNSSSNTNTNSHSTPMNVVEGDATTSSTSTTTQDDTVLSVQFHATVSEKGDNHGDVQLALQSTRSHSRVLLLACAVSSVAGACASEVLSTVWHDVASQLRAYESLQAVVASQASALARLRRALSIVTAQQVQQHDVRPLEAMKLIVNAKKARIVELMDTVATLQQRVQTLEATWGGSSTSAITRSSPPPPQEHATRARRGKSDRGSALSTSRPASSSPAPVRQPKASRSPSASTCDTPTPSTDDEDGESRERTKPSLRADATLRSEGPRHAEQTRPDAEQASTARQDWLSDLFAL